MFRFSGPETGRAEAAKPPLTVPKIEDKVLGSHGTRQVDVTKTRL